MSICFTHIEWREDALLIFFSKLKNDQTGQRLRDPRHLYANPVQPWLCPVLALGAFFALFEMTPVTATRVTCVLFLT